MSDIILSYRRVDGDRCEGQVAARDEDGDVVLHRFGSSDFASMLTRFAEALGKTEGGGVIQRTDREGLVPYVLDPGTVDLFRTDPVAAVASMSVPYGSPSTTVKRIRDERLSPQGGLRIGHATLADGFGDELYARYDSNRLKVECPCCGIWANTVGKNFTMECLNPKCSLFTKHLEFSSPTDKWATFKTNELLELYAPRYYFPRTWNLGSWISWDDLNAKYEQYKKEKASCP